MGAVELTLSIKRVRDPAKYDEKVSSQMKALDLSENLRDLFPVSGLGYALLRE